MDLAAVGSFVEHVGLPVAMLVAFGWWIVRKDDQARADVAAARAAAEKLDSEHRLERVADRAAHLVALEKIGLRLEDNTKALVQVDNTVRDRRAG